MFGLKGRRSPQNLGCFQMILFQSGTTIANTNSRHHDFEVIGQRLVIFITLQWLPVEEFDAGTCSYKTFLLLFVLIMLFATDCFWITNNTLCLFPQVCRSYCSWKYAALLEAFENNSFCKIGGRGTGGNRVYCGEFEKTEPFKPLVPVYVEVDHLHVNRP